MHEWALAESIVLYLKEQGYVKAKKILICVGILQNLDKDVLAFAINELLKSEGISVDEVVITDEDPVFQCITCGYTWILDIRSLPSDVLELVHFIPEVIHVYYRCPRCGSRDFEILRGRGVSRIEVIT